MKIKIYQIDRFANELFLGNPAAISPLSDYFPEKLMHSIAQKNNLSETAFIVPSGTDYSIPALNLKRKLILATAYLLIEHLKGGK